MQRLARVDPDVAALSASVEDEHRSMAIDQARAQRAVAEQGRLLREFAKVQRQITRS